MTEYTPSPTTFPERLTGRFAGAALFVGQLALTLTLLMPGYALAGPKDPLLADDDSARQYLMPDALLANFYTFSPDEFWLTPDDSWWRTFSTWAMGQHEIQSERVQDLGEWADRTLSGSTQAAPTNESYLRVGFATESEYGNPAQLKPEARFRLDVPTAEKKFRLVLESESDELIPLSERRRDRALTEDQRTNTDATGALRFLTDLGDSINLNNDLGIRLRFPPDAFWRVRARGNWQLANQWRMTLGQRFYYFHVSGWGERSSLSLRRPILDGWQFVSSAEAAWVHSDRNFELSQTFSLFKRLNSRATLNPRFGVLGESNPNWRTTSLFADLTYRYRLYDNWLYGEVIPAVEFPREYNFKDRASLILRIELFFSGNLNR